jgi:integrase/recombinase XerD
MNTAIKLHRTSGEADLRKWLAAFMRDRKTQNLAAGTLGWYRQKLGVFLQYTEVNKLELEAIAPDDIRGYLLWLEQTGHNPGGVHGYYRALRTFFYWLEDEWDNGFKAPIRKVKAPKVTLEPLPCVELETVKALLDTCENTVIGKRDKAILLILLDTGCRAGELLRLNLEDVDIISGMVLLKVTKSRKPRAVFLGQQARRALRAYLKTRSDDSQTLLLTRDGQRLGYSCLRGMVVRRSQMAGVDSPSLHSFRRGFAVSMLRAGVDIVTLRRFMGHSSTAVLERYLYLDNGDMEKMHALHSPADKL